MPNLLIVVDFQNDFVSGSLGFSGAEALEGPIVAKIEAALAAGDDLAFTLDTHDAQYLQSQEGRLLPIPHCVAGTEGHKLYGRVADYAARGITFYKPIFGSAALMRHLLDRSYDKIELCGLVSNICVLSNAIICRTAQPETEIIVDSLATAGPDPDMHRMALEVMRGVQIRVL